MKKLVVLSGSGISVDSGIPTFRDKGGLWEGYDIQKVATPEGWQQDPATVLEFYNQRRKAAAQAPPNEGHKSLAALESHYNVTVITQNIDDLHERAGSKNVIHLHGEIKKVRSEGDENLIYDIGSKAIKIGDKCEKGYQLRPHVVWFGEMVPMMEVAVREVMAADIFIVVGTSLQVYPAAGLLQYAADEIPIYIIDPGEPETTGKVNLQVRRENASEGLQKLKAELLAKAQPEN